MGPDHLARCPGFVGRCLLVRHSGSPRRAGSQDRKDEPLNMNYTARHTPWTFAIPAAWMTGCVNSSQKLPTIVATEDSEVETQMGLLNARMDKLADVQAKIQMDFSAVRSTVSGNQTSFTTVGPGTIAIALASFGLVAWIVWIAWKLMAKRKERCKHGT